VGLGKDFLGPQLKLRKGFFWGPVLGLGKVFFARSCVS